MVENHPFAYSHRSPIRREKAATLAFPCGNLTKPLLHSRALFKRAVFFSAK
jgi:hypothetical protein